MPAKPSFQLPFNGSWFVLWGGDTRAVNAHHDYTDQKYALDLLILDTVGSTHRGKGRHNEDYYAYGKEIVAIADGTVIQVVSGIAENKPLTTTNAFMAQGNTVLIRHSDRVYSLSAHLQPATIKVQKDQQVRAGEVIGTCGNSGNSAEPHLHIQLQDSEIWHVWSKAFKVQAKARGIKPYFDVLFYKDGKSIAKKHYSPIRGDVISN